jgi:hypothetical protein
MPQSFEGCEWLRNRNRFDALQARFRCCRLHAIDTSPPTLSVQCARAKLPHGKPDARGLAGHPSDYGLDVSEFFQS